MKPIASSNQTLSLIPSKFLKSILRIAVTSNQPAERIEVILSRRDVKRLRDGLNRFLRERVTK